MIFTDRIFSCLLTFTSVGFILTNTDLVQAATLTFDFDVSIDSGALAVLKQKSCPNKA